MDVPSPLGGVVRDDQRQGRRQGVAKARVVLTLSTGSAAAAIAAAAPAPPLPARRPRRGIAQRRRARLRTPRRRATPARASTKRAFALAYASPGVRKFARELGVDLGTRQGQRRQGPHPARKTSRRSSKGALAPAREGRGAGAPARGVGGIDLLPWPKVDFAKFGPIEVEAAVADQEDLRREPAPQLGDDPARHAITTTPTSPTSRRSASQLNKENEKSGVKVTMLAFLIKAAVAALQEVPGLQRLARRRQPDPQEVLPHRLRRRHAERPGRAGDPRRRQEGRGRDREGDGRAREARARRQAQARPDAGRLLLDLEPRRHRRHLLHADHQRAGSRDPRRVPLVLEAGVETARRRRGAACCRCRCPGTTA